jgi:hypothetical protein
MLNDAGRRDKSARAHARSWLREHTLRCVQTETGRWLRVDARELPHHRPQAGVRGDALGQEALAVRSTLTWISFETLSATMEGIETL